MAASVEATECVEQQAEPAEYTAAHWQDLRKALLATVYNETVMQLIILQRGERINAELPYPRRRAANSHKASVEPTFGQANAQQLSHTPDGNVEEILDEQVLNSIKYERDIDALRAVYESAYADLCEDAAQCNLVQAIDMLRDNNNEQEQAHAALQAFRSELQALRLELEQKQSEGEVQLQALDERIADTKHKLKCVHNVNELEYDLVERWEASRLMQASIWGEKHERAYLCEIIDYKRRLAGEQRIMQELHTFRRREQQQLRSQIAAWQQKFVHELKRVDGELEAQEQQIAQVFKALERHREVYEERVAFVREYEAQKAEEQRQHELQVHRVDCAVRIQAWWRGTMVRRGLGPFKRKPKKGKKGKGKGK